MQKTQSNSMDFFKNLLNEHKVVIVDNFISEQQCQWYRDYKPKLSFTQTLVSDSATDYSGNSKAGHSVTTSDRVTSQSSYYNNYPQEYRQITDNLKSRVAELVGLPTTHVEHFQTSIYYQNTRFDYHEDCGLGEGNERWYTALIYITKPKAGGQTDFLNLKKTVDPEPGRLLIWNNLTEDLKCNHQLLHAGLPVIEGEKHILVTWIRVNPAY